MLQTSKALLCSEETWLPVRGFEGAYEVSNLGRIKSLDNRQWRTNGVLRIGHPAANGYLRMVLTYKGIRKTVSVARIVAEHFVPNPDNLPTVDHEDFDVTNNRANNLKWATIRDNIRRSSEAGRHFRKPVAQLTLTGTLVKVWPSAWKVQQELGYAATNVSASCRGRYKSYKNFKWQFHADNN